MPKPSSQAHQPTPKEIKRRAWTERLAKRTNEYLKVNQQIDEMIDDGMRSRQQQKAERLFQEMEKLQTELDNL